MAKRKPILITDFTGQAENPHIGFGANIGVDLYTTKGVARLSRKMEKTSGTLVTGLPLYSVSAKTGSFANIIFVQDENAVIYQSTDNGTTWTVLTGNTTGAAKGRGLVIFENYLLSANDVNIDAYGPLSGSSAWVNNILSTALSSTGQHIMFSIGAGLLNIGNKNLISTIQVASGSWTPTTGGVPPNIAAFTMPTYYQVENIGFMPTSYIAIAVSNTTNNSQADVIMWDGISTTNAVNVINIAGATGPVKQLLTKNGQLYVVTDLEHGIYQVNGTSSKNIERLTLRMSNRTSGGAQYTTRVVSNIRAGGADFLGPELLTGGSSYPTIVTQISGTGLYPYGVWAANIESEVINTKYPLSHGDINANYDHDYEIGMIKCVKDGRVIVGWSKSNVYGIDSLNASDYISDSNTTFIESSYYEVGTRSDPETFSNLEFNLVEALKTGEQISFYWRSSLGNDYQAFTNGTFTSTNLTSISGLITPLPFSGVKYIQIACKIQSSGGSANQTPQLRSVLLHVND